jgi:hemoglobin
MTLLGRNLRVSPSSRAAVLGVILCGAALQSVHPIVHGQVAKSSTTLYERLGAYDGVAAYIALVFPRVAKHPELAHMFRGHGKDSQQRQFQLVVELICQKTGGPCAYVGRPMPPVHDGLGITEANWTTFMKIISDGMNEKKYPADVREEFLALWRSFHDSVVQK